MYAAGDDGTTLEGCRDGAYRCSGRRGRIRLVRDVVRCARCDRKEAQAAFPRGIELLDPRDVEELSDPYVPGLVAFAHEGAGDSLAWDRRRSDCSDEPPVVVYCDHETRVRRTLVKLADEARARPASPVLPRERDARRVVAHLIPEKARAGMAMLPPTYLPMLSPDDPKELDEQARGISQPRSATLRMCCSGVVASTGPRRPLPKLSHCTNRFTRLETHGSRLASRSYTASSLSRKRVRRGSGPHSSTPSARSS